MRDVKNTVEKAALNNVIDDESAELFIVDDSKPGNIYCLPKIYKNVTPPPGRPICNTINTPKMNLSRWVNIQLQPLIKNLPSYLKDDNHFLRKIDKINKNSHPPTRCFTGNMGCEITLHKYSPQRRFRGP